MQLPVILQKGEIVLHHVGKDQLDVPFISDRLLKYGLQIPVDLEADHLSGGRGKRSRQRARSRAHLDCRVLAGDPAVRNDCRKKISVRYEVLTVLLFKSKIVTVEYFLQHSGSRFQPLPRGIKICLFF